MIEQEKIREGNEGCGWINVYKSGVPNKAGLCSDVYITKKEADDVASAISYISKRIACIYIDFNQTKPK